VLDRPICQDGAGTARTEGEEELLAGEAGEDRAAEAEERLDHPPEPLVGGRAGPRGHRGGAIDQKGASMSGGTWSKIRVEECGKEIDPSPNSPHNRNPNPNEICSKLLKWTSVDGSL